MEKRERFARTILNGFEVFFAEFQNITLAAKSRFENADWQGMQNSARRRIDLRKQRTREIIEYVELVAGEDLRNFEFWKASREIYANLVAGHNNFEIAETFFNSVYCAVFDHRNIRDDYAFVFSAHSDMPAADVAAVFRSYSGEPMDQLFGQVLADFAFDIPYENLTRDLENILLVAEQVLVPQLPGIECDFRFEVLEHHFFRNKGAYIVGRAASGDHSVPFVLPILHNERGAVFVDTVLFGADKLSVIFSFTRSYFLVDARIPSAYVLFLKQLMPAKPISEIYSAMGYNKHGKTYFHRSAYRHMTGTTDRFVVAPGIKGMVMSVFTMDSYPFVFKIIKDRFTPPKDMSRQQVKDKYEMVKRWDRAGRMADTQEFTNLTLARERFSDELMEELWRVAPSVLEERGKALIIKHVYVERRMTPLNLYLQDATEEQVFAVMDEYGNAIKQLAAANIFPGDMLLKNFGVTRHGRVVFYDYDEIVPLLDCNFRVIPEPRTEEEEMASQPWYSVAPNDIFPEEFRLFFSGNQRARSAFDALHSDIYQAAFWQSLQAQIRSGYVESFFPYRRKLRFNRDLETA